MEDLKEKQEVEDETKFSSTISQADVDVYCSAYKSQGVEHPLAGKTFYPSDECAICQGFSHSTKGCGILKMVGQRARVDGDFKDLYCALLEFAREKSSPHKPQKRGNFKSIQEADETRRRTLDKTV